jgi:tetraacyldisaccharide 4'-kinase
MGLDLAGWRTFPDHHRYSEKELDRLRADASSLKAGLLTTRKDWVRIPQEIRQGITPLDILLRFEDEAALDALLTGLPSR